MNLGLKDKVIIITGATGGIGSQMVADFLEEGSIVVCFIRAKVKMEKLQKWIADQQISTDNLHSMDCDIGDFQNIKKAIESTVKSYERIDVLINCAGFTLERPFALLEEENIDEIIDLNLKSPLYLSHAVLRTMFRQKEGCIINISSTSATKKGRGIATYAAAKSGLDAFTRALSYEVGKKNIRVNCIRPGVIYTPMSVDLLDHSKDAVSSMTALGRPGYPKEISKAALFIASGNTASYMTGECITIDGGMY